MNQNEKLEELQNTLEDLQADLEALETKRDNLDIYDILSEEKTESDYDDFLDDVYGDVDVAGYSYSTSKILAEVDPIAYRVGFNDYIDSLSDSANIEETDAYQEIQEQIEDLEAEIEDLETEISDLEADLEDE